MLYTCYVRRLRRNCPVVRYLFRVQVTRVQFPVSAFFLYRVRLTNTTRHGSPSLYAVLISPCPLHTLFPLPATHLLVWDGPVKPETREFFPDQSLCLFLLFPSYPRISLYTPSNHMVRIPIHETYSPSLTLPVQLSWRLVVRLWTCLYFSLFFFLFLIFFPDDLQEES